MKRDYIYEWCGIDNRTFTRLLNAFLRAQEARQRVYLPRYYATYYDAAFEREFACFDPKRKAA